MIRTRTRTYYQNLTQPAWPFLARQDWAPTIYLAQPLACYPDRYRSNMPSQLITSVMPSTVGMLGQQKALFLH